jgi:hypothetical protein
MRVERCEKLLFRRETVVQSTDAHASFRGNISCSERRNAVFSDKLTRSVKQLVLLIFSLLFHTAS